MILSKKSDGGFSLIEMLVALAISSLILAGVVQIFAGSKQADVLTISLARVQESGRFATEILNEELRLAGYQGCSDPNQDFIPTSNILANNFVLTDVTNQVIEGVDVPAGGGTVNLYSGAISITDAIAGTSVVSITSASPTFASLDTDMAAPDSVVSIGDNAAGFTQGDVLLVSNCTAEGQFVFKASAVGDTAPVEITHTTTDNSSESFGGITFETGATVRRITNNTYYVKDNPLGIRSLYRRAIDGTLEEMIEGVDNLQILYGHYDDNNTASSTDDIVRWVDATTINSTTALEWRNVVSIKAALLVADDTPVLAENGPATYAMLNTNVAAPATDNKLRRVFTTTAKVRNRDGSRISQ